MMYGGKLSWPFFSGEREGAGAGLGAGAESGAGALLLLVWSVLVRPHDRHLCYVVQLVERPQVSSMTWLR